MDLGRARVPGPPPLVRRPIDTNSCHDVADGSNDSGISLPLTERAGYLKTTLRLLQRVVRRTLRASGVVAPLVVCRLTIFLVLVFGLPLLAGPTALALGLQAQESPYQPPPPPDSGGFTFMQPFMQPFQRLPVWAQAALFSAVASLAFFLLIEGVRVAWQAWEHGRHARRRR